MLNVLVPALWRSENESVVNPLMINGINTDELWDDEGAYIQALSDYAHWKDGEQFVGEQLVGTCGTTLKEAILKFLHGRDVHQMSEEALRFLNKERTDGKVSSYEDD